MSNEENLLPICPVCGKIIKDDPGASFVLICTDKEVLKKCDDFGIVAPWDKSIIVCSQKCASMVDEKSEQQWIEED